MKRLSYPITLAASLLLLGACQKEVFPQEPVIPEDQKTGIAFTASAEVGMAPQTKAGFSGGMEFGSIQNTTTHIVARFSSCSTGGDIRHTKTILSSSYDARALNGGYNWSTYSAVDYLAPDNKRYWDDAWGRDAHISVYAVAIPNYQWTVKNPAGTGTDLASKVKEGTTQVGEYNKLWKTDDEETNSLNKIEWTVSQTQTDGYPGTIAQEDLCYSHNIQKENDPEGALQYGRGKDGVRIWKDGAYPEYSYNGSAADKYPALADGTMNFRLENNLDTDGPGHFDKGHLIFRHALTRITVNLKKSTDDGFNDVGITDPASDFVLTAQNVEFLKMPYTSTLDYKTGTWSGTQYYDSEAIQSARRSGSDVVSGCDYTCFAQVIPGYTVNSGSNENVFRFTVSDNTYYVTQDQIFNSLNIAANTDGTDNNGNKLVTVKDNKIVLEQGKNYVFTITVKKTGVDVSASLVPWVEVTGEGEARNDYVKIAVREPEAEKCTHFDLYRLNDDLDEIYAPETGPGTGTDWQQNYSWYGNYEDKAEKSLNVDVWDTEWFWESNKTFYHFRTVNEGIEIQKIDQALGKKDYFKIFGGPIQDYTESVTTIRKSAEEEGTLVNDYHWGAPFKQGTSMLYNVDYGWSAADDKDGQIYPAIGSTSQTINLIEHHMMANVRVILKTMKDDTKEGKLHLGGVNLKGSTIKLTRLHNEGTVEMGRGLVSVAGSPVEKTMTAPSAASNADYFENEDDWTVSKEYSFRVVPQALVRNGGGDDFENYVGLTITTPDPKKNQYYVIKKLTEIKASSPTAGNQTQGEYITRWYPGHDYTYTINISKQGIDAITCSVVDWNIVKGEDFDLGLED